MNRFGEVVVGADVQSGHDVLRRVPAGDHNDRKILGFRLPAHFPADFEAVDSRHGNIQEQQVGRTLRVLTLDETSERGTSALSDNYLKVFVSGVRLPANQLVDVRIVSSADGVLTGDPTGSRLSQPLRAESLSTKFPSMEPHSMMTCASA